MAANLEVIVTAIDRASGSMNRIGRTAGQMGRAIRVGAIAGGAAVAGLGIASLKMAADFEKSMAEVRTLLPQISDQGFAKLQDDLIAFSKEMGVATDQSVPALYQAISAGVPAENAITFLETATKAATGGVTDLTTAVDGITSVVNAYGEETISATEASDLMFTAVRLGKTTFPELSQSLFNVIPIAAASGVSFDQVTAALAALTAQGVPTAEATTQLRAAIQSLSAPTVRQRKLIDELGLDFSKAHLEQVGLSGAMKEAIDATGGNMETLRRLIGSVEGVQAVLALGGEQSERFTDALSEMENSAGATDAAFATISETAAFKFNKAINTLKIQLMEIGLEALPHVTRALEVVAPWLERNIPIAIARLKQIFQDLRPALQTFAALFVSGLRTIKPLVEDLWRFLSNNKAAMIAALLAIGAAVVIAFGPGAIAVAALVGLITLIGLVRDNWDEISAFFQTEVVERFNGIIETFKQLPIIGEIFETVFGLIQNRVQFFMDEIRAIIQIVTSLIKGDWDGAWNGLKDAFNGIWTLIESDVRTAVNGLAGIVGDAFGAVESIATTVWGGIAGAVRTGINGAISVINEAIGFLENRVNDIINGINSLDVFGVVPNIPNVSFGQIPIIAAGGAIAQAARGRIYGAQEGGIFMRPAITAVAEAGRPEAVVPLDKGLIDYDALAAALVRSLHGVAVVLDDRAVGVIDTRLGYGAFNRARA